MTLKYLMDSWAKYVFKHEGSAKDSKTGWYCKKN